MDSRDADAHPGRAWAIRRTRTPRLGLAARRLLACRILRLFWDEAHAKSTVPSRVLGFAGSATQNGRGSGDRVSAADLGRSGQYALSLGRSARTSRRPGVYPEQHTV